MTRRIIQVIILLVTSQTINAQDLAFLNCSNNQCAYPRSFSESRKKSFADNISLKLIYGINSLKSMKEKYVVESNSNKGLSLRVGNHISSKTLFYTEFGYSIGRINTPRFLESIKSQNTIQNKQMIYQENNNKSAKLSNLSLSIALSKRFKLPQFELEPYIKLGANAINTNLEYQVAYSDSIVTNRIINKIHGGKTNLLISPTLGLCLNKNVSQTMSLLAGMEMHYNIGQRKMTEAASSEILKSNNDKTYVTTYQITSQFYIGFMWQPALF